MSLDLPFFARYPAVESGPFHVAWLVQSWSPARGQDDPDRPLDEPMFRTMVREAYEEECWISKYYFRTRAL